MKPEIRYIADPNCEHRSEVRLGPHRVFQSEWCPGHREAVEEVRKWLRGEIPSHPLGEYEDDDGELLYSIEVRRNGTWICIKDNAPWEDEKYTVTYPMTIWGEPVYSWPTGEQVWLTEENPRFGTSAHWYAQLLTSHRDVSPADVRITPNPTAIPQSVKRSMWATEAHARRRDREMAHAVRAAG